MYHIYKTEGFVLDSLNFGESNKFLYIFTKDFGLINSSAQGLRKLNSKLRYGLQSFCHSEIALVKGKKGWRITSAKQVKNLFSLLKENKEALKICAGVFALLKKMLAGEEKDEKLFEIVRSGLDYLADKNPSGENLKNFEFILILKILERLGYVGKSDKLEIFTSSGDWNDNILETMNSSRQSAIREINRAIRESQMVRF